MSMGALRLAKTGAISRPAWLESRRRGIGGSDAAAIVGLNPYVSPFQVYCDKMGLLPEKEDTEAMRQGRDFEGYVARRFMESTGKKVRRENYVLAHPERDFLIANVDRLVVGERAGLECKTTSVYNRTDFEGGDVPPQYYAQCLHYMLVTGFPKWYLAVLVLNKGFHVLEMDWHEADAAALLNAEAAFWENHVLKGVPPEPDGTPRAGEALSKLYPNSSPGAAVNLCAKEKEIRRLLDVKADIKGLEAEKARLENVLKAELKEGETGVAQGYVVEWKNASRKGVDEKRLKDGRPDVYREFLKETSYRKFTVKEMG
ncbi:MAG: YqaJ viral recombinase family protein [Acidaminococcales bacterium]|jgi:putative phage-type endonuclease|nr:YqaJ viral recombinase family protein [Acidaminococcales bacterium]